MSLWKYRATLPYLLVVVSVFAILALVRLPGDSYLWRELHNFGHTPLFGMVALALLGLASAILPASFPRFIQYLLAGAAASVLGLGYELIQIPTPGDSDPLDIARNSAGIFGLLAIRLAADRNYWRNRPRLNWKRRLGWLTAGLVVLLVAALPLMVWSVTYLERDNSFPQLTNFDSIFGRLLVIETACELELVEPPDGWHGATTGRVASLTCYPTAEYPGLLIDDPVGDWENFSYLYVELFSPVDSTVPLVISIADHQHNHEFDDRFSRRLEIVPGPNRIELSLDTIRITPSGRLLNLNSISRINLFVPTPEAAVTLLLGDLILR